MKKVDLISKVVKECYEISTKTKYDVFFQYSPHCNNYDVSYYIDGWNYKKDAIYIDLGTEITIKNLQKTLKELSILWQQIEENNLKKNYNNNLNN